MDKFEKAHEKREKHEKPETIVIRIKRRTAEKLKDLGTMRDSYDKVINRLIEAYKSSKFRPSKIEKQITLAEASKHKDETEKDYF